MIAAMPRNTHQQRLFALKSWHDHENYLRELHEKMLHSPKSFTEETRHDLHVMLLELGAGYGDEPEWDAMLAEVIEGHAA